MSKLVSGAPVFGMVARNEGVLEEAVRRHVALIDAASRELAQQARLAGGAAQAGAIAGPAAHGHARAVLDATNEPAALAQGGHAAQAAVASAPAPYEPAPAAPVRAIATRQPAITRRELRLLAAAAAISLLSALVALGGQAVFFNRVQALTPEQTLSLREAAKLKQAVDKLDPQTRARLQAELEK